MFQNEIDVEYLNASTEYTCRTKLENEVRAKKFD